MTTSGRTENKEMLNALFSRLVTEHGPDIGTRAFRAVIEELGGLQIRIPSVLDLEREERDRRVRQLFDGFNTMELAIRFGLSTRQIRRIVRTQPVITRDEKGGLHERTAIR